MFCQWKLEKRQIIFNRAKIQNKYNETEYRISFPSEIPTGEEVS